MTDNSAAGADVYWEGEIIMSNDTALDLSGAAVTQMIGYARADMWLRKVCAHYTEASSADAGVNIGCGISTDVTKFAVDPSSTSQALYAVQELTIDSAFVNKGEKIVVRSAGGKTGTGEVKLILHWIPFNPA